jgi:hypothetical protein
LWKAPFTIGCTHQKPFQGLGWRQQKSEQYSHFAGLGYKSIEGFLKYLVLSPAITTKYSL